MAFVEYSIVLITDIYTFYEQSSIYEFFSIYQSHIKTLRYSVQYVIYELKTQYKDSKNGGTYF